MVVDPDKDKIYTKRKTRLSNLPAEHSPELQPQSIQAMVFEGRNEPAH